jgi:hypothetical protein
MNDNAAIATPPARAPRAKRQELTVVERANRALSTVKPEEKLRELAASTTDITTITNADGYKQCRAARIVLKEIRVDIQRTGKDAREDATAFSKAVIAEEKRLIGIIEGEEERLQTIEEEWDAKIEAERQARIKAEEDRIARLEERVQELRGCQTLTPASGSATIMEHIDDLEKLPVDGSFGEFQQQADDAKTAALTRLRALHKAALDHEAAQRQIEAERKELAQRRAEDAERERKADAERAQREEADRARQRAEQAAIRKNEAALQEIQAIHHQLFIADAGRRPYCKGGDLESHDWVIAETEKWEITEDKFGVLYSSAVKAKETTLAALRQKRADLVTRLENAAQAQRLADQQAEIDRQQEELRKAKEPPTPSVQAPAAELEPEMRTEDVAPPIETAPVAVQKNPRSPYSLAADVEGWRIGRIDADGDRTFVGDPWDDAETASIICDLMNGAWEEGYEAGLNRSLEQR